MTMHYLLYHSTRTALQRWRQAFPAGGECADPDALLERAVSGDSVWVDARRPDWLECVSACAAHPAGLRVAVLSAEPNAGQAAQALDAGARAYAHLFAVPTQFEEIAVVMKHGGWWLGPDLMRAASRVVSHVSPPVHQGALDMLSVRECEVARAVASGLSNKEVAQTLGITERTVKAHLGAAFEKLGVRDRLQLVLHMASELRDVEATG